MEDRNKTASVTFRIDENLKNALDVIAKRKERSLSGQIQYILKKGVREYFEQFPDLEKILQGVDEE